MGRTGLQDYFGAELSEWQLMKERGLTTFVEVPLEWGKENQRSECYPRSSAPNYHFFRTVCGIKPLSPRTPRSGNFPRIREPELHQGNLSAPSGQYRIEGEKVVGELRIPETIRARFIYKGQQIELKPNGRVINFINN